MTADSCFVAIELRTVVGFAKKGNDLMAPFTEVLVDLEPRQISLEPLHAAQELGNQNLPIYDHKQEVIDAIRENSVVILAGPTGSGKTTQVPQFAREMKDEAGEPLFDDIIMTQPRIVAARTVSERIREELSTSDDQHSIGYYTSKGRTPMPQRLQDIAVPTDGKSAAQILYEDSSDESGKKRLLIIDEVHEWSLNIEQLVAIANEKTNPESKLYDKNLKVVIMSATMDCERLQKYFEHVDPPLVEVSVPTYEVTRTTSQKPAALVALEKAREKTGKVLAFFASVRGISKAEEFIHEKQLKQNSGSSTIPVIPLHAQQNEEEQARAFAHSSRSTIVATTNVAETSLTVPDATVVVSSGQVYEDRVSDDFLPDGTDGLHLTDASQANIDQQAGRVGRTGPGEHVLASPGGIAPHVPYEKRPKFATPAMERSRLDSLLLQLSATEHSIDDFTFFHKPPEQAVQSARNRLKVLGALDDQGEITERGQQMDALPLDPELACMIVFAREKGYNEKVVRNIVDIVSIMQTGGILKRTPKEQKWRGLLEQDADGEVREKDSDFLAQLEAYIELAGMDESKWEGYDIHIHSAEQVDENRETLLRRLHLGAAPVTRVTQEDRRLVLNCINAGQLNQVWRRSGEEWTLATGASEQFELANGSVVNKLGEFATGTLFSLGVGGGRVFNTIQNVNTTSLQTLETVASQSIGRE